MSVLDALLEQLPRTTLVVGKGGVGKTTCAVGLAAAWARGGHETLLISTDPAAALADVVGAPVRTTASPVGGIDHLEARQLSAAQLRDAFLREWRDIIADIIDRGTYLDRSDVDGLVDAALPGADEVFALLALAELLADTSSRFERLVVDTAPTGHTLRLLALPDTFHALVAMLDMMQDKHRFMVRALTHRYKRDRADAFLDEMRRRIDALRAALADPERVAAIVVARGDQVVLAETARYVESLRAMRVRISGIVMNAVPPAGNLAAIDSTIPRFSIPNCSPPPRGAQAVLGVLERITAYSPETAGARSEAIVGNGAASRGVRSLRSHVVLSIGLPTLTIVAGKGGVGKSTVACALAITSVDRTSDSVLLVSTDPAPSLADALGESDAPWARIDIEHTLAGVPRLTVRQIDASAAFARVRDEYQSRIDALFDALVGRGLDMEHDRAIVRDLLALAPPGIDELFALSILGDEIASRRFDRLIVDPAPTGHLLRLLDMPAIALDWTHRLMRLMLKYRDVVALGDTAQELLDFAKRTRALDALLHDAGRSAVIAVALDEPVVRAETERLASAVREREVPLLGIVWNRVGQTPEPLPATVAPRQYCAEDVTPPPIGVDALRAWAASWRELPLIR